MTSYVAFLRRDRDSDIGVDFPDFPGCVTAGRTLDEARAMAIEALQFHVDGLVEDGGEPPTPSSLDAIFAKSVEAGVVAVLVDVKVPALT